MNEQVTSSDERAEHPVRGRAARLMATASPLTRALVLAGLTTAATLVLRSPESAAGAAVAMPPVDGDSEGFLPISFSIR
ncbi:hypothetical protein [Sphaerimonospora thailandensis]|uniref:Uncharacterized protein n=1 Tax=Sphaerimonospora thailandensis TaxID=795644 RepID=A0A8J3RGU6_9ACTN|nr:hypothetical protein [Sphaerimonospora thailandensis]GIH72103.1 hypothetical protein Mth01_43560 [Sphaerimonospora thailandensis]